MTDRTFLPGTEPMTIVREAECQSYFGMNIIRHLCEAIRELYADFETEQKGWEDQSDQYEAQLEILREQITDLEEELRGVEADLVEANDQLKDALAEREQRVLEGPPTGRLPWRNYDLG